MSTPWDLSSDHEQIQILSNSDIPDVSAKPLGIAARRLAGIAGVILQDRTVQLWMTACMVVLVLAQQFVAARACADRYPVS